MPILRLKALLKVMSEKFSSVPSQCSDHVLLEPFKLKNNSLLGDSDLKSFKRGIEDLSGARIRALQHPEGGCLPIMYEVLLVIFSNTTPIERQYHLNDLLDYFHGILIEKLLKSGRKTISIPTKQEYSKLVRECIPYVKLELLQRAYKCCEMESECEFGEKLKYSIKDLYECVTIPKLLREECCDIVSRQLRSKNYDLVYYELLPFEENPGSLGEYSKLKVNVKYNGQVMELFYFCKFVLEYNESLKELAASSFKKEEFFYMIIIPLLKQFGLESETSIFPKCCLVRSNELVLLEDMCVQGCYSLDIHIPFEYQHLLLVVKQLAKLHASSIVFEEKMSNFLGKRVRIDEYFPDITEELFLDPNKNGAMIKPNTQAVLEYFLNKFPDIPKHISLEEFRKRAKLALIKFFDGVKKSDMYRNVISHGDMWSSNIFFKNNKENEPKYCFLVDFQMIRYCPPAVDLLSFLYINTDRNRRSKYISKLSREYYLELKQILDKHGTNIEDIYPYDVFLSSCQSMKPAAIWKSLIYLQYLLIPKDKLDDMRSDKDKLKEFFTVDRSKFFDEIWDDLTYTTRIKENMEDLYDICLEM